MLVYLPASSCCLPYVKILAARTVYDILCLKYRPDCPLKYGPFSYFIVLTKRLKIAIWNKLHCKLKLGICTSLSIWQIYDRFLCFELLLHASNWNSRVSVSISESIFTFQFQILIFSFIWRHIVYYKTILTTSLHGN